MLRLNVAIPPAAEPEPARHPRRRPRRLPERPAARRRRRHDRAAGDRRGRPIPLVDPTFTPDGAVGAIEDGTFADPGRVLLDDFPYIGMPYSGYDVPAA